MSNSLKNVKEVQNFKECRRKECVEDNHLTGNKVYCHSGGYPHSSTKDDVTQFDQFQRFVTQIHSTQTDGKNSKISKTWWQKESTVTLSLGI